MKRHVPNTSPTVMACNPFVPPPGSCRDGLASPLKTLAALAFATGTQGRLGLRNFLIEASTRMWIPSQKIDPNFITPSREGVTSRSSRDTRTRTHTTHTPHTHIAETYRSSSSASAMVLSSSGVGQSMHCYWLISNVF